MNEEGVKEKKIVRLDACSLFIFDSSLWIRQAIVRLVEWKHFDSFIMSVIVANSIMLCLED